MSASQFSTPLSGLMREPWLSFLHDSVRLTVSGDMQAPEIIEKG